MENKDKIITATYDSPCGYLILGSYGDKLCMCDWLESPRHRRTLQRLCRRLDAATEVGESAVIEAATRQLDEYFNGQRRDFDVPLQFEGTDFQKTVWSRLQAIPYGSPISYSEMAKSIGKPTSIRAIANAIGDNALSIFTPCHRVVGSDGALTGYAGGLDAKRFLLALEQPE